MKDIDKLEQKVKRVIAEVLDCESEKILSSDLLLEDLGLDSLLGLELLSQLEKQFKISVSEKIFTTTGLSVHSLTKKLQNILTPTLKHECWPTLKVVNEVSQQTQLPICSDFEDTLNIYQHEGNNDAGYSVYRRKKDNMSCVLIPHENVVIGSEHHSAMDDEKPIHNVKIESFLIDIEPITNWSFARFLNYIDNIPKLVIEDWCGEVKKGTRHGAFGLHYKKLWKPISSTESKPVVMVSWYGANAYSLWANGYDWRYYKGNGEIHDELKTIGSQGTEPKNTNMYSYLPSEVQWEYAARGKHTQEYPWGNSSPTPELTCASQHDLKSTYNTAADYKCVNVSVPLGVSPFGVYHMAGNVWNWCRDWYDENFYKNSLSTNLNAQNHRYTGIRSERGGSWVGSASLLRSSYRRGRSPYARGRCLGFRCVGTL
ncbi:formylglycine-generating enzyme family protein [Candidatus Uabimicrobium sp. HlEnr_7]|uniref:formylglycine-generating enzyme family protein n=1 Tax=Candidatus Uabimicrobium helgolandensis TaxID=3095367 RepID=UPI003558E8B1